MKNLDIFKTFFLQYNTSQLKKPNYPTGYPVSGCQMSQISGTVRMSKTIILT